MTPTGFLSSQQTRTPYSCAGITRKNGESVIKPCLDGEANPDHETYTPPLHGQFYALPHECIPEIYVQSLVGLVRDLEWEMQVVCKIVEGDQMAVYYLSISRGLIEALGAFWIHSRTHILLR